MFQGKSTWVRNCAGGGDENSRRAPHASRWAVRAFPSRSELTAPIHGVFRPAARIQRGPDASAAAVCGQCRLPATTLSERERWRTGWNWFVLEEAASAPGASVVRGGAGRILGVRSDESGAGTGNRESESAKAKAGIGCARRATGKNNDEQQAKTKTIKLRTSLNCFSLQ